MNVILEFALVLTIGPLLAVLWSLYRATKTRGFVRVNAIALSFVTLVGVFFVLQYLVIRPILIGIEALIAVSPVIGGLTIVTSLIAVRYDPRLSKIFPIIQTLFGVLLVVGIPWQGI